MERFFLELVGQQYFYGLNCYLLLLVFAEIYLL